MSKPIIFSFALVLALAGWAGAQPAAVTNATTVVSFNILAGSRFQTGSADGFGPAARFYFPRGTALSRDETFALVSDSDNFTIRKIVLATAQVTTLAGAVGQRGYADGSGTTARFCSPSGIAISRDNSFALIADPCNQRIRKLDLLTTQVTTVAGSGATGSTDGIGTAARFSQPHSIALAADDSFALITDESNYTIRKLVLATGEVTTIAGAPLQSGSADGVGSAARFHFPRGIALSADKTIAVIADSANRTVRKLDLATGTVTTLAGQAGQGGSTDGVGSGARFTTPTGVSMSADGQRAIISDPINYTVRLIDVPSGSVVTLSGLDDGRKPDERPGGPTAVALNGSGNLALVTDTGYQVFWRIDFIALQKLYVPMAAR